MTRYMCISYYNSRIDEFDRCSQLSHWTNRTSSLLFIIGVASRASVRILCVAVASCCCSLNLGRPGYIIIIIIIIIALDNAPYKMLHKLKSACSIRKTNSEQVRLQVFRKSHWTNRQIPQFNRQLIPTAGTSNSKGSQTPVRPVARHNKIPTNYIYTYIFYILPPHGCALLWPSAARRPWTSEQPCRRRWYLIASVLRAAGHVIYITTSLQTDSHERVCKESESRVVHRSGTWIPGSDGPWVGWTPGSNGPRVGWTPGRIDTRVGWTPGSDHNCCGFLRVASGHDFVI